MTTPSRPRWHLGLLLLLGLVIVAFLAQPGPPTPTGDGPRPGETLRGQHRLSQATPGPTLTDTGTPFPPVPEDADVAVFVVITPDASWTPHTNSGWWGTAPQDYWPTPGEAPWPLLDSVQGMDRLAQAARDDVDGDVLLAVADDMLIEAEADGVVGAFAEVDPDDPWALLHAMMAERILQVVEDWTTGSITLFPDADAPPRPAPPATRRAQAHAEAIVAGWPDAPVADYARLHLLDIASLREDSLFDPQAAADMWAEIVETTDDPLVLDAALGSIDNIDHLPGLDALDALDRVAAHWSVFDNAQQVWIARFGLTQAFAHGDDASRQAWFARAQATAAAVPDDEAWRHDLALAQGQLAARGLVPITDWRSALVAAVWQCAVEVPDALITLGTWSGTWTWSTVDPQAHPFLDCLTLAPAPFAPPGRVSLSVHRADGAP